MAIAFGGDLRDGGGARSRGLGRFAQGQRDDTAPGSAWLAVTASAVSRPEVLALATGDEVLGIGRSWKTLETWTFARKLAVVRELIRRHPLDERWEPDGLPGEWAPELHQEVAAALGISVVAAGKLVRLAWTLDTRLRGTGQALDAGRLDPGQVKLIADETSVLEDEALFARAEEIILAALAGCRTWSDLQRLVQRAVITVDPDGARRRREKAEREHARLRFWRENWGTCGMQASGLPADEALAANARIEGRARAYKAARIGQPMDILRVMAYLDLINEVTIAQRVAWAMADAAARDAGADEQAARDAQLRNARDKARQRARTAGSEGQHPESDYPGDDAADSGDLDSRDPDGQGPDGDGDGDGDWPTGGADGLSGGPGLDDGFGEPDSGPLPEDPGEAGDDSDDRPCPACRGTGAGTGLPVLASLTVPAAALPRLAAWSAGNAARGPAGSGGGSPGPGYRGGPGPCPACGKPGSAGMPALRDLTLPLLTLLHLAERPGESPGLGALDPALVRDLAAAGARHPGSQFCVTVTDEHGLAIGHGCGRPVHGKKGRAIPVNPNRVSIIPSGRAGPEGGHGSWIVTLPGAPRPLIIDIDPVPTYECDHRFESRGYQPGDRLRHLVQVRDGTCSFPACSRQARESDFEHATPFAQGGRTCACNGHCCSRSCHRAKQSRGWQVTKPRPGWTRWTTGAGRVYEQGPRRYLD